MNSKLRLALIGIAAVACGLAHAAEEVAKPQAQPVAPAKPLSANTYAGYKGLTTDQLSRTPGAFVRNPQLPSSIPSPVFYYQLSNVPTAPPFISPAFAPRNGPPLGNIVPTQPASQPGAK